MIYNIEQIIHKVYEIPQLKKLSNYRCFDFILERLDENLAYMIEDIYYKYGYIYFIVKHPAVKMALQYSLTGLEDTLQEDETCKYMRENFKGFFIKISEED